MLEVALDRDLASHRTQLSEYELISMLSEAPGGRLRMSTLADLIIQSRSRVTHTAARLERRGWVRREACLNDRRGVELVLTDEGRGAVEKIAPEHVESVRAHLIDVMDRAEFVALGEAMSKVRDEITESGLTPEPEPTPESDLAPELEPDLTPESGLEPASRGEEAG